jgi:hypothetical protein
MQHSLQEIAEIITHPKNKDLIAYGCATYDKNMLHLRGVGMAGALTKIDHFENDDVYPIRTKYAISNVDLFNRLLQEEEQVYTTVGGQITIGAPVSNNESIGRFTTELGNKMPLRKWMQRVGYDAYNADPMGLLYVEHDGIKPTVSYKCIKSIHDYDNYGRELNYVCFKIDHKDYKQYNIAGIDLQMQAKAQHYRFVDDVQDIVVRYDNGNCIEVDSYVNVFGRVPGFIISDIVDFTNQNRFLSRLFPIIELADCFLKDRSVEQLQKNYHGFAKAIEPFLQCGTCMGEGVKGGIPCPDCSTPGSDTGSGYKRRTRISDVSRFPLAMLSEVNFDFRKIFGYVTPDIASMEYQNKALYALEALMYRTHWGSVTPAKVEFNGGQNVSDTATKVISDNQPKRAVLNTLADWNENSEAKLISLIVQFYTNTEPTDVYVSYNRDYILNTPEELMEVVNLMRRNNAPPSVIDALTRQYIRAAYKNNPNKQVIETKKYLTFPLVNENPATIEQSEYISDRDKVACRYYMQWATGIIDSQWLTMEIPALREMLYEYCNKNVSLTEPKINDNGETS